MATREEVIAAYVSNPKASFSPSEEAIAFWQDKGLGNFNQIVDEARAANPTLASQIDVQRAEANRAITGGGNLLGADITSSGGTGANSNLQLVLDAYKTLGRTGVGAGSNQIDQGGLNYFLDKLNTGSLNKDTFNKEFYKTVGDYYTQKPTDAITQYTAPILQENAYKDILTKAYGGIGRTGFGTDVKQIDQGGYDFWLNAMKSGQYNTNGQFDPNKFLTNFNSAVSQYKVENPTTPLTKYVTPFQPVTADKITSNMLVNALNPTGIATPTTPVAQFRELFPAFSESQRLAKEMVTNRPTMASIITMLQGQGQQTPVPVTVAGQATPSLSNVLNTISK
jgi:hypothetical protein